MATHCCRCVAIIWIRRTIIECSKLIFLIHFLKCVTRNECNCFWWTAFSLSLSLSPHFACTQISTFPSLSLDFMRYNFIIYRVVDRLSVKTSTKEQKKNGISWTLWILFGCTFRRVSTGCVWMSWKYFKDIFSHSNEDSEKQQQQCHWDNYCVISNHKLYILFFSWFRQLLFCIQYCLRCKSHYYYYVFTSVPPISAFDWEKGESISPLCTHARRLFIRYLRTCVGTIRGYYYDKVEMKK